MDHIAKPLYTERFQRYAVEPKELWKSWEFFSKYTTNMLHATILGCRLTCLYIFSYNNNSIVCPHSSNKK